jgi:hypothetical protein
MDENIYTRVPPLAKADITDDPATVVTGRFPPPIVTMVDFFPSVGVCVPPPPVPLPGTVESKN